MKKLLLFGTLICISAQASEENCNEVIENSKLAISSKIEQIRDIRDMVSDEKTKSLYSAYLDHIESKLKPSGFAGKLFARKENDCNMGRPGVSLSHVLGHRLMVDVFDKEIVNDIINNSIQFDKSCKKIKRFTNPGFDIISPTSGMRYQRSYPIRVVRFNLKDNFYNWGDTGLNYFHIDEDVDVISSLYNSDFPLTVKCVKTRKTANSTYDPSLNILTIGYVNKFSLFSLDDGLGDTGMFNFYKSLPSSLEIKESIQQSLVQ